MATGTFYRDTDGETYYRTPSGSESYHYWLIEGPSGDMVEYDFADIPAGATPYYPDELIAARAVEQFALIDPDAGEDVDPD